MSTGRLRSRIPGATFLGMYFLPGHRLCFHKIGRDGSGKCDAYFSADPMDRLPGVVYDMNLADKSMLDRIEGLGIGYACKNVQIVDSSGNWITAFTYVALKTDPLIMPYSWYRHHVLVGAREAGLPADHIAFIEAIPTLNDPDKQRQIKESAIHSDPTESS